MTTRRWAAPAAAGVIVVVGTLVAASSPSTRDPTGGRGPVNGATFGLVPTISLFYGIVIQMFWKDHGPPHFHALYAEFEALIDLRDLSVLEGTLPRRALTLVLEWATEHRSELMEDWELCRAMQPPKPIEPLK